MSTSRAGDMQVICSHPAMVFLSRITIYRFEEPSETGLHSFQILPFVQPVSQTMKLMR
jgi:hypothetical protein